MSLAATLRSGRGFGAAYCTISTGDAITRRTQTWYVFEVTGSSISVGLPLDAGQPGSCLPPTSRFSFCHIEIPFGGVAIEFPIPPFL